MLLRIDGELQLLDLDRQEAIADILNWIDQTVKPEEPAMIAVDAPTFIPNATVGVTTLVGASLLEQILT